MRLSEYVQLELSPIGVLPINNKSSMFFKSNKSQDAFVYTSLPADGDDQFRLSSSRPVRPPFQKPIAAKQGHEPGQGGAAKNGQLSVSSGLPTTHPVNSETER